MTFTKPQAIAYLTRRYTMQCENYPITREIPQALYIRRNLPETMALVRNSDGTAYRGEPK